MKTIIEWTAKHQHGLILGGILGFSIGIAYLLSQKKKHNLLPASLLPPSINMERYIFDLDTNKGMQQTVVEGSGECYTVHLNNSYVGSMWRDEEQGQQWNTKDETLKPYLFDISDQLNNAFSRKGFPTILKGAYPDIVSTEWKSSETLEVLVNPETDLEVFTAFLKDEAANLADFEEHIDLMVKRTGEDYFVIVGVN